MQIPDELEKSFKEEIMKRYGMKKGNIKRALKEAIDEWIKKTGDDIPGKPE